MSSGQGVDKPLVMSLDSALDSVDRAEEEVALIDPLVNERLIPVIYESDGILPGESFELNIGSVAESTIQLIDDALESCALRP